MGRILHREEGGGEGRELLEGGMAYSKAWRQEWAWAGVRLLHNQIYVA